MRSIRLTTWQQIMSRIIFRADGDVKKGLGHLIRSSALAGMLNDEHECLLLTRCNLDPLLKELESVFAKIISLPNADYLEEARAFSKITSKENLIVLDGYSFDDAYQRELFQNGFEFFSIDDIHASPFYSKVIINHSGGLTPLQYRSLPATQFYLGPRYSLLREPFLQAARTRRNSISDNNCLVCFGGADPNNQTLQVLKTDSIVERFSHFHVVIGNAYQYERELNDTAKNGRNITVHHAVTASNLVSIMQQCSYAICSPSTVVYEYLSVGGIVYLEQIADNQKDVINYFTSEGMAFYLKDAGKISHSAIEASFSRQATHFDGGSGQRLKKIFRQFLESRDVSIRKANEQDMELCYHWANDPAVRLESFNQSQISLTEHTKWFNNKLKDEDSFFYILESKTEPMAQIRFQVTGCEATLSYLASPAFRSKGLGTTILGKGIEAFTKEYNQPVQIIGYVKKTNIPSQLSFERLAFQKEEATVYPNSYKYTMSYGN
jgi:UDP-2,4-diacetamido-2,4,6-trideoxy-beta-L-altropyranose hydrolase